MTDPLILQNENLLRTFQRVQNFIPYVQTITTVEKWHRDLLACILIRCRTHFCHLSLAFKEPYQLEYIAWAARNLLELMIWAKYAGASKGNARKLHTDQATDMEELLKRTAALAQKYTPDHPNLEALKGHEKWIQDMKNEFGLDENAKHLNVGKIASELGLGGLFYNLNPLFSKLVHPTAFAINLDLDAPHEEQFRRMFLALGQGAAEDATRELIVAFDALGIETTLLRK